MKKKADAQIGAIIVGLAMILLFGGIFNDDSSSSSTNKNNNGNSNNNNNDYDYISEDIIFALNDTNIGKQQRVTENTPNIELGSTVEYNTIYVGNDYFLKANPFSKNEYYFDITLKEPENINNLLLYFNINREKYDDDILIYFNNTFVAKTDGKSHRFPINIMRDFENETARIVITLEKPGVFDLFNWKKIEMTDLRVVEERREIENNVKRFDFQVDKDDLERVYLDVVVSCNNAKELNPSIKVKVNDYSINDFNPQCASRYNRVTNEIPLNILDENKNTLEFETEGYYEISYSLNKIYFNDKDVYKFNIEDFSDIYDVIIYGDFDKSNLDLRLNKQTFSLTRNEIKSIMPYLRYGTNELVILSKPVEIDELVIEANEFVNEED